MKPKIISNDTLLFRHEVFEPMQGSKILGDLGPVLRIRIRIHMSLGLLDPDPDPLVRGMEPDPDPYPSIMKQK